MNNMLCDNNDAMLMRWLQFIEAGCYIYSILCLSLALCVSVFLFVSVSRVACCGLEMRDYEIQDV